ncbi:MAG: ATP-dependent sacrificial sulfur transferase LarE [Actinobacteria bacterium]|nr:MAG: ATP-dependent sacrificial sulfur transferase LarE [Actinomycetota bacterium]
MSRRDPRLDPSLDSKLRTLRGLLAPLDGALVAFSGGVDSTLLLSVANDVLGGRVLAVTVSSVLLPEREVRSAVEIAVSLGATLKVVELDPLSDESFAANDRERCYHCKKRLIEVLSPLLEEQEYESILEGGNLDDIGDERPGRRALREAGVLSPLEEAGLTKEDVRALSSHFGLITANKPSAACLASRFPYGMRLTEQALRRVAAAEEAVRQAGFEQVRVRCHGSVARLEVGPAEIELALRERRTLSRGLKEAGFTYVALDLDGYRTGSLNEESRG